MLPFTFWTLETPSLARGLDSGHRQLTGAAARTPFPGIFTHARPCRGKNRPWLASAFRLPIVFVWDRGCWVLSLPTRHGRDGVWVQPSRVSRLPCREICLPAAAMRVRGWVWAGRMPCRLRTTRVVSRLAYPSSGRRLIGHADE